MGPGHTVLAVPVPALDDVIRERTAHYDASFVSADPEFVHAHITLLGPWNPDPDAGDLETVAAIAAAAGPFPFRLAEIGEFPDGVIHLRPEPDGPFRELTSRLAAAFPQYPPYEGRYEHLVPHLTLDRRFGSVTPESVRTWLAGRLPVAAVASRIDLQWWANHDCRLLGTWPLG